MRGERGGRTEWKRQTERETLGGVVEQEGELRRTALIVQFKNKTKKMYLSLMMCQMYKREEGVNHEVAGFGCKFGFVFIHCFCFVFI